MGADMPCARNPGRLTVRVLSLIALLLGAGSALAEPAFRILLIPKGSNIDFWQQVVQGAQQEMMGHAHVRLSVRSPQQDGDIESQMAILDFALSQRFDAVVLAPTDAEVLRPRVQALCAANIKVLIIDSPLVEGCVLSTIATDNVAAGTAAAHYLAAQLDQYGEVLLAGLKRGVTSTDARHDGFVATLAEYPQLRLLEDRSFQQYDVGSVRSDSVELVGGLAGRVGIFAVNESVTAGLLMALRKAGKENAFVFVGFDDNPRLRQAVLDGQIRALIVQQPRLMGALGVRYAVDAVDGKAVPAQVDVPFSLLVRSAPPNGMLHLGSQDVPVLSVTP